MKVLVIPAGAKPDDSSGIAHPDVKHGTLTWSEVAALNGVDTVEALDGAWAAARDVDGLGFRDSSEPSKADQVRETRETKPTVDLEEIASKLDRIIDKLGA